MADNRPERYTNLIHARVDHDGARVIKDYRFWTDDPRRYGLTVDPSGIGVPTPAEVAAGVTPVSYAYPPGHVFRYGATGDGVTDDWLAIQNAFDSSTGEVFSPAGSYKISRPLIIKTTSASNIIFQGESRTTTQLMPLTIDISHAPQNINALIINQQDNGKFSIDNIRFQSDVAYTGISVYAVEGGGGDGLGQAIFSGSITNCWFGMSSQNTGVFRGGLNNYRVTDNVFEFCKGCFFREGVGMSDVIFSNNQLFFCWDAFYDGMTDTTGDNIITISNLHAYVHQRGQVVQTQNSNNLNISDVILQAATGAFNLGTVGLFKFIDCIDVIASNFNAAQTSAFGGSGVLDEVITIQGSTVKLTSGVIDIPDVGIRLTGNSPIFLTIDSVDIFNAQTASFRVQTGTPQGRVTVSSSNWSDSQNNIILFSNSAAFDFFMNDCRILNSGLGATAGSRNINISCSAIVRFVDCQIGQNNGSAAGAYYIDASGAGSLTLVDCFIQGTPPTGFNTGTQAIIYDGATGTWTPSVGGTATYTLQQGTYSVKSKCVNFWGRITINVIGTGNQTTISGLPFTNNASYYGCGVAPFFATLATNVTSLHLTVAPSASQVLFRTLVAAAAATGTANVMQNGTDIIFSGSYQLP